MKTYLPKFRKVNKKLKKVPYRGGDSKDPWPVGEFSLSRLWQLLERAAVTFCHRYERLTPLQDSYLLLSSYSSRFNGESN